MSTLREALIEATPAILAHLRVTGYLPFSEFSDGPSSMLTLEALGRYDIQLMSDEAVILLRSFVPGFTANAWIGEVARHQWPNHFAKQAAAERRDIWPHSVR